MNIVTIDLDIIMEPSIQYYNNIQNRQKAFHEPIMQNCQANLDTYNKISVWLYNTAKIISEDNIVFIESHEQILNHIPDNEKFFLINIDHHHDLGYDNEEKIILEKKDVNCGSWGRYLLNNNLINAFIWIGNKNSDKFGSDGAAYHYIDNFNLDNLKADKIIICLSPDWVPNQYHPLFFNWMNALNVIKNTNFFLN